MRITLNLKSSQHSAKPSIPLMRTRDLMDSVNINLLLCMWMTLMFCSLQLAKSWPNLAPRDGQGFVFSAVRRERKEGAESGNKRRQIRLPFHPDV